MVDEIIYVDANYKLMLIMIVVVSGLCCLDQAKSKGTKELLRRSKFCYGGWVEL
jgi:hypothetical protein